MVESKLLPEGSFQLICGSAGDLLDHLTCQDTVAFTGSASTGLMLRSSKVILEHNVRFNQEADSLNFSMLGPDAAPGTDEFDLFIKEVAKEMTVKAGQKCTAIRRTLVPDVAGRRRRRTALSKRLAGVKVGDPSLEGVRMGPLAGRAQVKRSRAPTPRSFARATELVYGGPGTLDVVGADPEKGAFFPATLLYNDRAVRAHAQPHDVEAFGPVNTIMPYGTRRRSDRAREAGEGKPRRLAVHGARRRGAPGGARHRGVSRAADAREPSQRQGIHGPRLAAAAPRARRPGSRRRR